jgi:penicillin-binding protein 1A
MSDAVEIPTEDAEPRAPIPFAPPRRDGSGGGGDGDGDGGWGDDGDGSGRRPKPRVRKLRILLLLLGFGILALASTVFGMMMSVTRDLPQLENYRQYQKTTANSYMYDDEGRLIGLFAPPTHEVIDNFDQISPYMRRAIVSVEDKRFWSDPGVDIKGIARALVADVTGGATQGASTIAEQFVKNALSQEDNRTIFEKLREAAIAYQLTHRWPRRKILREYLNSIYFGNGAYGVESAARVYFGRQLGYEDGAHSRCGIPNTQPCAAYLQPYQAALLAGMVANPSAFDPVAHPKAAAARRQLALQDMLAQHYITEAQYENGIAQPLPTAADIQQPQEPPAAPYFTSWLRPQILRAMGYGRPGVSKQDAEYRAYYGGLKIRTSLDLEMQQAADQTIEQDLPYGNRTPTAALVSIDNATGQVRAMVGGPIINGHEDFINHQFNLATEAERQPGSAFKPFTLAVALESGFGPDSMFLSAPFNVRVPNSADNEIFHVRNFGNEYSGEITLQDATDVSDNSVFTRLGLYGLGHNGTKRISQMATKMGIRTPVSTNPAMIIGGLKVGVSPLDMAHAYETFATGGRLVYDPVLGDVDKGPTGIESITCPQVCGTTASLVDHPVYKRVIPTDIANEVQSMLTGVVQSGTGTAAAISGVDVAGKTGTTTNYADAWFVGWTPQLTTAVWVGFPQGDIPMLTNYNGSPVDGGTYPALIWHDYMVQALQIYASEHPKAHPKNFVTPNGSAFTTSSGVLGGGTAVGNSGNSGNTGNTGSGGATGNSGANAPTGNSGGNAPTGNSGGNAPTGNSGGGAPTGNTGGGAPTGNSGGGPTGNSGGGPTGNSGGGPTGNSGGGGQTGNSGSGGAGVAGVRSPPHP